MLQWDLNKVEKKRLVPITCLFQLSGDALRIRTSVNIFNRLVLRKLVPSSSFIFFSIIDFLLCIEFPAFESDPWLSLSEI